MTDVGTGSMLCTGAQPVTGLLLGRRYGLFQREEGICLGSGVCPA